MLSRLPSLLPRAATSLARNTAPCIQPLPAYSRFNSSEAAPAPDASSNSQAESAPKKRAIPLAETLGDISITRKWGKPKNPGPKRQPWEGGGNGQRQGRPPRRDNNFRRDGQGQERADARPPRSRPSFAVSRPIAPRQWQESAASSAEVATQDTQEVVEVKKEVPVKRSPAHPKVQLGNIDDLFGSSTPFAPSPKPRASPAVKVTPSQARVQLLLEKTGGDYSRYIPQPFPDTTVTKLGPTKLAEFTLSHRRDVTPRARQNVLTVVKKFADRGTRAATV